MATESGAAIFRAIADFSRLRREARATKKDLKDLGDETDRANTKLGDTDEQATKTSRSLTGLGAVLQKLRAGWKKFEKSDAGKTFHKIAAAGDRLGNTLHSIRNKIVAVSGIAVAATAAVGPVLSLVAAVWQLSGAIGVVPGLMLAAGVAGAVLKVAFSGVDEVLKNLGERDAAKFEESIKNLPEPMRKVARAAWEIYPALESIKKSIQSNFWRGLEVPLKDLAGKYLPMARAQGSRLASTFNKMAKEFAGFLGQKSSVADVNAMLGNTNGLFRNLVGAVKPLTQAFLDIFTVSSEFLPGMGKGITGLTEKFAAFIRGARESGKLKEWIQGGLDALSSLGRSALNIGRIFSSVWKAAGASGINLFDTLERLTGKVAAFLASARGQESLKVLFDTAAAAGKALWPVVAALGAALIKVLPVFVKVGEQIAPGVAKLIEGLANAIAASEPELVAFGAAVGDLLMAFGESGPVLEMLIKVVAFAAGPVGLLAAAVRWLSGVLDSLPAPVRGVVTAMLGFGVVLVASIGFLGKTAWGVFWLVKALGLLGPLMPLIKGLFTALLVGLRATAAAALAHPVIAIITAIALIALLIITHWDTVKVWLAAFFAWLAAQAQATWGLLVGIWNGIAATASAVWSAIRDFLIMVNNVIRDAVIAAAQAVWNFLVMIWTRIRDTAVAAWHAVGQAISDAWAWITGIVSGAVDAVLGLLGRIGDFLGGVFGAAWRAAGSVVTTVIDGITAAINAVVDAVRAAVNAIKSSLSAIGGAVSDTGSWVARNINPLNWFQHGGLVPGSGAKHRPIMAQPGEYVEPVSVTRKYLPLLRAINPHDAGGQPADVLPMLGVNDLLRNAAGGATIAAQVASSVALSSGRSAGADPTPGRSVGDVHVTQIIHNPAAEKPSESASKRIGRAAALGVHVALNGAA